MRRSARESSQVAGRGSQPVGNTYCASGSGTRVSITERGEVYNPIFRFLSRFVFGHTGTMETYLRDLARKQR